VIEKIMAGLDDISLKMDQILLDLAASKKAKETVKPVIKKASVRKSTHAQAQDEFVTVYVYEATAAGVVVGDKGKKRMVHPGEKLPGGITFLKFDATTRMMKTDHGDFLIPS
jgi:hypothetical protein